MSRAAVAVLTLFVACTACGRDAEQPSTVKEAPIATAPALTSEPETGTEKGAREFATAFLQARMAEDEKLARSWLSPTAVEQYGKGEGGLVLTDPAMTTWDFLSVKAADASSYEMKVGIWRKAPGEDRETSFTETLFVGPGPDAQGRQRPWIVRGAMRGGG